MRHDPKPGRNTSVQTIHILGLRHTTMCGIESWQLRSYERYVVYGDRDESEATCQACVEKSGERRARRVR